MALRFIGVDPNTGDDESLTVWVEQQNHELVFRMVHMIREACDAVEHPDVR
ncbi:hypothetical protein [Streptomyces shenzhenensis]|uniref:hypothetical protein n=1 Tax=Streptomyces shenzhenensis TaxID=943815 RepID=UPI0016052F30|nr:hypothetical protein [Streptomyces shenzhenensis]